MVSIHLVSDGDEQASESKAASISNRAEGDVTQPGRDQSHQLDVVAEPAGQQTFKIGRFTVRREWLAPLAWGITDAGAMSALHLQQDLRPQLQQCIQSLRPLGQQRPAQLPLNLGCSSSTAPWMSLKTLSVHSADCRLG